MDLYLQFGYGMKNIVIDLSKEWNGVNAILSPRDIRPDQLIKWSKDFQKNNSIRLLEQIAINKSWY